MHVDKQISKSFSKSAKQYELAAKVQREIGNRLFERLHYLKITPQRVLDLGCGGGQFSKDLAMLYPKAHIIGLDFAQGMLLQAKGKQSWRRKWSLVNANMAQMPFAAGAFDLVFANQVIHWGESLQEVFRELNRVMNLNGCLMFSTLGPDTFNELKSAWSGVNHHAHVNEFADMHDVGDFLMGERFVEPVVDMEVLSVHYASVLDGVKALKLQGVRNVNPARNQGLTGRAAWAQFENNYERFRTENGKYPLTYEVVYGHAWKGEQRKTERGTETVIPISQIVRSKNY